MTTEEIRAIQQHGIKMKKEEEQRKLEEMQRRGITPQPPKKPQFDHPDSLENDEATVLWIFVMLGGSIFRDRIGIWIIATIIWWRYITRHSRKK